MHLTRTQLRRMRRTLIALATLPWTLPCLAEGGLQGLPDHELLAVHGAGLDDVALGRMGVPSSRERDKERQDGPARDATQTAAQTALSARSQQLANAVSRQALQMEVTAAGVAASSAVRVAATGVSLIAPAPPAVASVSLPLMGLPMLPGRH